MWRPLRTNEEKANYWNEYYLQNIDTIKPKHRQNRDKHAE